jgi:hypothetical protein
MRRYLPRCRTCGPLNKPTDADTAYRACREHRHDRRSHSIGVVPIITKERNQP